MDLSQCSCSGKSLAKLLRPGVMAVLAKGSAHGYLVAQRLARLSIFAGDKPDHAGLYRTLRALEAEGLVASTWDLAESGPARRQYELTPAGRACLAQWLQTLATYRRAIDELLRFTRARLAGGPR